MDHAVVLAGEFVFALLRVIDSTTYVIGKATACGSKRDWRFLFARLGVVCHHRATNSR